MRQVDERRDAERLEPRHPLRLGPTPIADREASGDERLGDEVRLRIRKMAAREPMRRRFRHRAPLASRVRVARTTARLPPNGLRPRPQRTRTRAGRETLPP